MSDAGTWFDPAGRLLVRRRRFPRVRATRIVHTCTKREHLHRTGLITVVVGSWLTLFNHGDLLVAGTIDGWLLAKVFLNYLTPFVVANLGLLSRETE